MPFALTIGALLTLQFAAAADYWLSRDAAHNAARRLRVASLAIGIGLIALVTVAWSGLGIESHECSTLSRVSDMRSSEEYVLGSCLVAGALSLLVALAADRSRRVVAWLAALALAATVIAALYFASHAYYMSCLHD
jgi:hypothetical protein